MNESGNKTVYYEDDYVVDHIIDETEKWPQITFRYKPLSVIQVAKLTDEMIKAKGVEQAINVNLQMLTKHIVAWDLKKPDGNTVDFASVAELRKIDARLMNTIIGIVKGDNASTEESVKALEDEVKNL